MIDDLLDRARRQVRGIDDPSMREQLIIDLIAEVERLQDKRVPELTAEIVRLHNSRARLVRSRRVIRLALDYLRAEHGRAQEEIVLLKRRIDGLEESDESQAI